MENGLMNLQELLQHVFSGGASDIHLKVGRPPMMRLNGDLTAVPGNRAMEMEDVQKYVFALINPAQKARLESDRELDFSFQVRGMARFRGNAYYQKGFLGAAFRLIPMIVPTLEQLGLADVMKELIYKNQGLFLVTGPTGSGKSTTLAALLDYVNASRPVHIITLEDPIEFVYEDKMAIVNQREVGADTLNFAQGLRRALRQDPDIILIGELRDAETIITAMNAAETGHLVLGTLHTNDAKQAIDRIVDTFPPESQHQVLMQLAKCLVGVVAQRLIKRADGQGQVAIQEVMINTPTIQKLIEDNRVAAIGKAIEDSQSFYKMQSFNQALMILVRNRMVHVDEALAYSNNPNDLRIQMQSEGLLESSVDIPVDMPPGLRG